MPSPSTCEKAVSAASAAAATRAPPVQLLWPRAAQGKRDDKSASADAVGSLFGFPVADRLCGAYLDRSSAW
jgi:hypothetical protein